MDVTNFGLFLAAAFVLAVAPGPGLFYVLARSLKGGRREGVASSAGTAVGGLGHVVAAALGLSLILASSAVAFGVIKYAGAVYLIYLGIRTILSKDDESDAGETSPTRTGVWRIFCQGVLTEVLNPKTALFFLAFIPQFVNPEGDVVLQFLLLGCISVFMNSSVDLAVALLAGPLGQKVKRSPRFRRGQKLFSGGSMIALGAYVALTGNSE